MLEESSAKKDERIRELELQVEYLNDWDAEVTISLCEFDSFLIKHNLRVDEFEEKMEAAVENLQESVQENRSMAEYLGEEIHCSHRNDLEDNMFHGVGDRHHPGFSRIVLESCSPSPSPIIRTCASSLVSQDLLQASSPSTESWVLGDSSRVEDTSWVSTPPPLEEVQPMVVRSPHRGLHLIGASSRSTPYSYHSPGSSSSSMTSSIGSRERRVHAGRDSSDRGAVSYDSESVSGRTSAVT